MLGAGSRRPRDFRQLERAADDGEGAAAIDERPDADGLVNIGPELELAGRHRGCGRCGSRTAEKHGDGRRQAAAAKQIAPAALSEKTLNGNKHRTPPALTDRIYQVALTSGNVCWFEAGTGGVVKGRSAGRCCGAARPVTEQ